MSKIVSHRITKRKWTDSKNEDLLDDVSSSQAENIPRVLVHRPKEVSCIGVTTADGSRVYLRLLENNLEEEQVSVCDVAWDIRKLYPNWNVMKAEADLLKEKFKENISAENTTLPGDDCLWVDKYRAKTYFDLLTSEVTNKSLLHWLKSWDKYVFGIDYGEKVRTLKQKYGQLESTDDLKRKGTWYDRTRKLPWRMKHQGNSLWFEQHAKEGVLHCNTNGKLGPPVIEDIVYDHTGRPKLNVALLHGPTGYGKTTCAHIVARLAGYSVVEINASDNRSAEAFKMALDSALQSRPETFVKGRPNCLIIDEIDEAPTAAVQVLVHLIEGKAKEKGQKGRSRGKMLHRPVICICNDVYACSLRELKRHAFVIQFSPIGVDRLAERLQDICSLEKLNVDLPSLLQLCNRTSCDIHSCLSALQFVDRTNSALSNVLLGELGFSDKSKSLFDVWSDIFTIPQGRCTYDGTNWNCNQTSAARFRNVLKSVHSFGEYEKLMRGVFENYLLTRSKDTYFDSVLEGLSWGTWFQDLYCTMKEHQSYELMGYFPLYFAKCHFLYAQKGRFKLRYPSAGSTGRECSAVLSRLVQGVHPRISRFIDNQSAVVDLLPYLLAIIQPCCIKPLGPQLWTCLERKTVANVVAVMINFNISYQQIKNATTGIYSHVLEPDILWLTQLNLENLSQSLKLYPNSIQVLLANELETEKIRRSYQEPAKGISSGAAVELVKKDFFGRTVDLSEKQIQNMNNEKKRSKGIYFRYNEGHCNAVRRFVKMKDLLL